MSAPDGLLVVDKPSSWTSHDVVARLRRLAGTRRVGHAGTLDPMATGVLVVGVGKATRLLGHLALREKDYDATIRLGTTTTTDDADGEVLATASADLVTTGAVRAAMSALTGAIEQVPSSVSAIKLDGVRAYRRVRAGEDVVLAPRPVRVTAFELVERTGPDLAVRVSCSTGTYVRALARDLGAALGVGAHLRILRRTRVGPYTIEQARTLSELAAELAVFPLAAAVAELFARHDVDAEAAERVRHGVALSVAGLGPGPVGVFGPGGELLALVEQRGGLARPLVVFASS